MREAEVVKESMFAQAVLARASLHRWCMHLQWGWNLHHYESAIEKEMKATHQHELQDVHMVTSTVLIQSSKLDNA